MKVRDPRLSNCKQWACSTPPRPQPQFCLSSVSCPDVVWRCPDVDKVMGEAAKRGCDTRIASDSSIWHRKDTRVSCGLYRQLSGWIYLSYLQVPCPSYCLPGRGNPRSCGGDWPPRLGSTPEISSGKHTDVFGMWILHRNGQTLWRGYNNPERRNCLSPWASQQGYAAHSASASSPTQQARCRRGRKKVFADHAPYCTLSCWGKKRMALSVI